MYRELLETNLETARKAEKRSSFLYALLCLLIGAFIVTAWYLFKSGTLEPPSWFPYDINSMGTYCIVFGILMLVLTIFFLVLAFKNFTPAASDRRMETILKNARAIGPEDEVFSELEQIEPKAVGDWELRFNEKFLAGISSKDPDAIFLYPMSEVICAGIYAGGKKRKPKYNLYIHAKQDGKTKKAAQEGTYQSIREVLDALEKVNPKLTISKNAG